MAPTSGKLEVTIVWGRDLIVHAAIDIHDAYEWVAAYAHEPIIARIWYIGDTYTHPAQVSRGPIHAPYGIPGGHRKIQSGRRARRA